MAALCKQLLCLKVTVLHLRSGCGLRLGRQAAWRPGVFQNGVVTIGGGTVQAVAVFRGDCLVRGLWLWASTRPSSCLAAVNVAASRCCNCCCNQQRRGGVTSLTAVANSSDIALCGVALLSGPWTGLLVPDFPWECVAVPVAKWMGVSREQLATTFQFFNNLKYRSDSCRGVSR